MQDDELLDVPALDPEDQAAESLDFAALQPKPLTAAEDGRAAFYASLPQPTIRDMAFPGPPSAPPPPAPTPRPPLPTTSPNPIVRAIAMAAMGVLGPQRGGAGLGRGILEAEAAQRQQALQDFTLQERRAEQLDVLKERGYRDQVAQHRAETAAWTAAATQQQRAIQSITGQLATSLASGKLSEDQANALIDQAGDRLTALGVRGFTPNDLRAKGYRYTPPDEPPAAFIAVKRLIDLNGGTAEGLNPEATVIVNKREMPLTEAMKKAGLGGLLDAQTGLPLPKRIPARPLPIGKEADIEQVGQAAVAKAKAEGLTPDEVDRLAREARDKRRREIETIEAQVRAQNKPAPDTTGRDENRLDKSYQFQAGRLERARKPIVDQAERLDRLQRTVYEKTPQADALIAPELLTVMAGGMGSGLRMTEAEIARIVGGRSHLESLKAALAKFDPNGRKALSITDDQRAQIQSLMTAVAKRSREKLRALDLAESELISAPTVNAHRRIVSQALQDIEPQDITPPGGGGNQLPPATYQDLQKAHGR